MSDTRKKKLVAIMFTDIVGYTAFMQRDEVLASKVRDRHREAFSRLTAAHSGKIIQYYGDGTLSVFGSASDAVECALDIQRELRSGDPQVPLRIGIHTGDIYYSAEEVYGDGVNVSARIESVCPSGGVLISEKVYDDIKNQPTIRTVSLGEVRFKNVERGMELFALANPELNVPKPDFLQKSDHPNLEKEAISGDSPQRSDSNKASFPLSRIIPLAAIMMVLGLIIIPRVFNRDTDQKESGKVAKASMAVEDNRISVAVLPFVNMSESEENEYFSDGITEDILTLLSKIDHFDVVSRTTAMLYKNTQKSIREIGEELGATKILEGSVRRDGDRVRITAQLIDARTDKHIWADVYDKEMKDIFEVQTNVATDIASALETELTQRELMALSKRPTDNVTAYDYYLRGREYYRRYKASDNDIAISLFDQALEIDSAFALAYAGLGDAYAQKAVAYHGGMENLKKSLELSRKALELDPNLSEGYKSLGLGYHYLADFEKALEAYHKAVELDPKNAMATSNISSIFLKQGDLVEAYEWSMRTQDILPVSGFNSINVAKIWFDLGDAEKAFAYLSEKCEKDSQNLSLRFFLGIYYVRDGQMEKAKAEAARIMELEPENNDAHELLGAIAMVEGNWEAAAEHLDAGDRSLGEKFGVKELNHGDPIRGWDMIRKGKKEKGTQLLSSHLEKLLSMEKKVPGNEGWFPRDVARTYLAMGDTTNGMKWLNRLFQEEIVDAKLLQLDPILAPAVEHPSFVENLKKQQAKVEKMRKKVEAMERKRASV